MNFRRAGIVAGILCLTLLVAWFIFGNEKKVVIPLTSETPTEDGGGIEEVRSASKTGEERFYEKNEYYTIDITYPVTKNAAVNAYIKEFVDTSIERYKKDVAWAEEIESAANDFLSLVITHKNISTTKAETYSFTIGTYTGGAHGLHALEVMRFTPQGQPIAVTDLFTNGVNGLKSIAPFVQKELEKGQFADTQWIAEGTTPTLENYQNIIITEKGITVTFEPYSVAPYAAGMQEVAVPLSVFEKVANLDFFSK